jgi:hypothetical protein
VSISPPTEPLRSQASFEQAEPDEEQTITALCETLHKILDTTSRDYGHAVRSVRAKSHGLLRGELRVAELPPVLAQGVFAQARDNPFVARIAVSPQSAWNDVRSAAIEEPRALDNVASE